MGKTKKQGGLIRKEVCLQTLVDLRGKYFFWSRDLEDVIADIAKLKGDLIWFNEARDILYSARTDKMHGLANKHIEATKQKWLGMRADENLA